MQQEVAVNMESLRSVVATLAVFYLLFVTGAAAQTQPSCTYFIVVTQDTLKNIKQGLSADDVLIYRLLRWGQPYVDEGAEAFEQRYRPQQHIKGLAARAKELGNQLMPTTT
jgi:hypothetical protein